MLSRRSRRVLVLVPAAAALVATSACGAVTASSQDPAGAGYAQAGNGDVAPAPAPAPQIQQPAAGAQEPALGGEAANRMLAASQSAKLGAFVVNANGFALYRFDKDTAKPSKSNCEGECAKTWTPMIATGRTMVSELDAGQVGEVARADGTLQVTYAGWPLYTFTGDRAPGRTSGQGKGGTWWLITPDGTKVTGAAASPSGSAVPGSGATGS